MGSKEVSNANEAATAIEDRRIILRLKWYRLKRNLHGRIKWISRAGNLNFSQHSATLCHTRGWLTVRMKHKRVKLTKPGRKDCDYCRFTSQSGAHDVRGDPALLSRVTEQKLTTAVHQVWKRSTLSKEWMGQKGPHAKRQKGRALEACVVCLMLIYDPPIRCFDFKFTTAEMCAITNWGPLGPWR